jgi:hypothetical protein
LLAIDADQQITAIHFAQESILGTLVAGGEIFKQYGFEAATEQRIAQQEGFKSCAFGDEFLLDGTDENATFLYRFSCGTELARVADL